MITKMISISLFSMLFLVFIILMIMIRRKASTTKLAIIKLRMNINNNKWFISKIDSNVCQQINTNKARHLPVSGYKGQR